MIVVFYTVIIGGLLYSLLSSVVACISLAFPNAHYAKARQGGFDRLGAQETDFAPMERPLAPARSTGTKMKRHSEIWSSGNE